MDSATFRRLLLLDDPEYIEIINQINSCLKGEQPFTHELNNWINNKENLLIYACHGLGSEWREQRLCPYETEGETQMRHFRAALNKGEQPAPATLDFFKQAFEEIQNGRNAKEALRIKKKQGRKKTVTQEELKVDAAYEIIKMRINNSRLEDAINTVAEKRHKDSETIKGYHKNKKAVAQNILEVEIALSIEVKNLHDKIPLHKAIESTAIDYNLDSDTIKGYHEKHIDMAKMLAKLLGLYMAAPC